MYKIGDFSKIVGIPIRTLRFYDQYKVLQPSVVDNFTGYRYYSEENIIECEMIKLLKAPPTGDSRCVCFHVLNGKKEEFKELFNRKYGKCARLLTIEEVDELRLVGPEKMCEKAKKRFGDFCALMNKEYAFLYVADDFDREKKLKKGRYLY